MSIVKTDDNKQDGFIVMGDSFEGELITVAMS
jgi:hypothetical protein